MKAEKVKGPKKKEPGKGVRYKGVGGEKREREIH